MRLARKLSRVCLNPRCASWCKSCAPSPWLVQRLYPLCHHGPSPELAPAPAADPRVNEPQISILDRHVTKFPLGGVSPGKEVADPVENENVPDDPDRHAPKFPLGGASPEKEGTDPVEEEKTPEDPEAPPRHGIPLP